VVAEFRDQMAHTCRLHQSLPAGRPQEAGQFRLRGWINVNRGAISTRSLPPGMLSLGTYYVEVPAGNERAVKSSSAIHAARRWPMYETPGIDLPWVGSGLGFLFSDRRTTAPLSSWWSIASRALKSRGPHLHRLQCLEPVTLKTRLRFRNHECTPMKN